MPEKELGPGSEGDAYRYTKKVLLSLPNRMELERIYDEIARNRGITSWTRAAYMELRRQFFRDGQCKIKFAPGAARIAFGELLFGTGDEDFRQLADLRDYIRIISIAHFEEYTRHLATGGTELSFKELTERYGGTAADNWKELKRELRKISYGPRRYRIIWLDRFETGKPYYKYTQPHGWCHLNSKSMFDSYSFNRRTAKDGTTMLSMVKLYLAVLPGFETMTEDDPLYGESMLGIDIGPDGRLMHVNNRWNHAHDNVDERKGDNKYSERELSELLGAPFYRLCTPYTKRDYRRYEAALRTARERDNRFCLGWARLMAGRIAGALSRKPSSGKARNMEIEGGRMRAVTDAGTTWLLEPVSTIPVPFRNIMRGDGLAADRQAVEEGWRRYDEDMRLVQARYSFRTEVSLCVADDPTAEPGDPVQYDGDQCVEEDTEDTRPQYRNLSVLRMPGGGISVYRADEVAVLSQVQSDIGLGTANYDSSCSLYKKWRSENLGGDDCDPIPGAENHDVTSYAEDGTMSIMFNDWCALEIASPLGFCRSYPPSYTVNGQPVVVDDISTPGRNFVKYRAQYVPTAIPEGWRLPTVDEFISMAMRHGSTAEFDMDDDRLSVFRKFRVSHQGDFPVKATPGDGRDTVSECLFEGFVDGNMERRHQAVRPERDRDAEDGVSVDEDLDESRYYETGTEEFGINIDRTLPQLGLRFPALDIRSMEDAGFTMPATASDVDMPSNTGRVMIPLVIPPGRGGNSRELRKGMRGIPARTWTIIGEADDDIPDDDNETSREEDGTLYAVAELDRSKGKITITAEGSLRELRGYFTVYCVRDRKK